MIPPDLLAAIDALVVAAPYAGTQAEKEARLLPVLRALAEHVAAGCAPYARFLARLGTPPSGWARIADLPPLPVGMFKRRLLSAVPPGEIVRELRSSGTTGDRPSRIPLDKGTAFRQTRALTTILKDHLGGRRRPYLVLDAAASVADGEALSARGAAIRGVGSFASETVFALRLLASGDLEPDFGAIEAFLARHGDGPVLAFGFTFIVFSRIVEEAERRGLRFRAPGLVLVHSGGWKKLRERAVSKEELSDRAAAVFGTGPAAILDFYGMVEQVGTVFVDCPSGSKHAPAFADVVIRRAGTLEPVSRGEEGLIEVVSALPSSYPGQAILTEDQGVLLGVDDCPCGRRGVAFRFTSRVERAALRGCGDVFAASRESR
jgi:hypothetical protein